jgi:hypothetical protein
MDHFVNFRLLNHSGRFHVYLPWNYPCQITIITIDDHLKLAMPPEFFEQTRQLKLSQEVPEQGSLDFHTWHRNQRNHAPFDAICNRSIL